ncbi:ABC transporter substrate-binding protein [Microbacterium sp. C23T]
MKSNLKFSKPLGAMVATTAVVLALAGCSSSAPAASDTAGAADEDIKLAFVPGLIGDEFYISMKCGVEAAAADLGVSVDTQGPTEFDPTLQRPILDTVIASKPDALITSPTDTSALTAPLTAAVDSGIKLVLVDTTIDDPSIAVSSIASDNVGGGAEAFSALKELVPDGGKVLVMSTDPGVSTLDQRVKGFEGAVNADSSFEYVGVQYSHNDPAEAARLITAALAKDPDIVGVFAGNTASAEGSATGIRQAGKEGQVKIVGFDAGPAQIKQLKEGTVQALIAQSPEQIGRDGVEQAVAAIKGEKVTKEIQTDFAVITQDNVDTEGADYVYKSSC